MKKIKDKREFTIIRQSKPPKNMEELLIERETLRLCYKTNKGFMYFTNKRIILKDTTKKNETCTIPFSSITVYSIENSKGLRSQNLLQIWTNPGLFLFHLKKSVKTLTLNNTIAALLL